MARKKLPTSVKIMQGTYRKHRENPDEPQDLIIKAIPEPPVFLNENTITVWYHVASYLIANRILTAVVIPILIMYCCEVQEYNELLILKPDEDKYKNLRARHQCLTQIVKLASELGLTPASRSNISPIKEQSPNIIDEILQM